MTDLMPLDATQASHVKLASAYILDLLLSCDAASIKSMDWKPLDLGFTSVFRVYASSVVIDVMSMGAT